ncbi:MAG: epoxyqueuosine reductase [Elusimicrobiales bacterium]
MKYDELKKILARYSITDFSVCSIEAIPEFEIEMPLDIPEELSYLKKDSRKHPRFFYPEARSVLVMVHQYWHSSQNYEEKLKSIGNIYEFIKSKYSRYLSFNKENPKIARYALVEEYHKKIRKISKDIIADIKKIEADIKYKIFVDSSPVYEKKLAQFMGLGFIGKNTLLVSPSYGSYVFISGIMLNKDITETPPLKKTEIMCGSCELCIRRCPTKALSPLGIDPSRCISFWTTHTTRKAPDFIISASDFIFGCDICQEVCPFNSKSIKGKSIFNINAS